MWYFKRPYQAPFLSKKFPDNYVYIESATSSGLLAAE